MHVGSHELLVNSDQVGGALGAGTLLPCAAALGVNKYWCIVVVMGLSVLHQPPRENRSTVKKFLGFP